MRDAQMEQAYERILESIVGLPGRPRDKEITELAVRYTEQERFEEAATLFRKLASTYRDRKDFAARSHYFRALSLIELGGITEARHQLRHALAIDPQLDDAQNALDNMGTVRLDSL